MENWGGISADVGVFLYLCSFGTSLNEDKHKDKHKDKQLDGIDLR